MKVLHGSLLIASIVLLLGADTPKPRWTTDLRKMKPPETPAAGRVLGADFRVDRAKLDVTGALTLLQGTEASREADVVIFLPIKPGQLIEGKSYKFGAALVAGEPRPHVHIHRRRGPTDLPQGTAFGAGYALWLEFGSEKYGKIPGKIYLCMPDQGKSFVAGTFELEVK